MSWVFTEVGKNWVVQSELTEDDLKSNNFMRSLLVSNRNLPVALFHHGMILWRDLNTVSSLDHSEVRMWEKSDNHKVIYTKTFVINVRRSNQMWYLNIALKSPKPVNANVIYTQSEHDYLV